MTTFRAICKWTPCFYTIQRKKEEREREREREEENETKEEKRGGERERENERESAKEREHFPVCQAQLNCLVVSPCLVPSCPFMSPCACLVSPLLSSPRPVCGVLSVPLLACLSVCLSQDKVWNTQSGGELSWSGTSVLMTQVP